jgi:hypothetical protein
MGRFVSRDPISFSGGINLYEFCDDDPIDFDDPLGLDATLDQQMEIASSVTCSGIGAMLGGIAGAGGGGFAGSFVLPGGGTLAFAITGAQAGAAAGAIGGATFGLAAAKAGLVLRDGLSAWIMAMRGAGDASSPANVGNQPEAVRSETQSGEVCPLKGSKGGSTGGSSSLSRALARIFRKYPPTSFNCELASAAAKAAFENAGQDAEIVRVGDAYGAPVLKNAAGEIISTSGYHEAVRVGDLYYDALTGPQGATWSEYLTKFDADTGQSLRIIGVK